MPIHHRSALQWGAILLQPCLAPWCCPLRMAHHPPFGNHQLSLQIRMDMSRPLPKLGVLAAA